MKRLDMIVNKIYENGSLFGPYDEPGHPHFLYFFRGSSGDYPFVSKVSIKTRSKNPRKLTLEKLFKKEIKMRLLDRGWYKNDLRRYLQTIKYRDGGNV